MEALKTELATLISVVKPSMKVKAQIKKLRLDIKQLYNKTYYEEKTKNNEEFKEKEKEKKAAYYLKRKEDKKKKVLDEVFKIKWDSLDKEEITVVEYKQWEKSLIGYEEERYKVFRRKMMNPDAEEIDPNDELIHKWSPVYHKDTTIRYYDINTSRTIQEVRKKGTPMIDKTTGEEIVHYNIPKSKIDKYHQDREKARLKYQKEKALYTPKPKIKTADIHLPKTPKQRPLTKKEQNIKYNAVLAKSHFPPAYNPDGSAFTKKQLKDRGVAPTTPLLYGGEGVSP
tara:strand:- start:270 stop:1121 length:852 start_codon:yes stop_codon:yes gene_type:complete